MAHVTKLLLLITMYCNLYATIAMPDPLHPKEGDIRLASINGFRASEAGNVFIYHSGRWGTICDDGWTVYNAEVVCRMLGFPKAIGHTKQAYFGIPAEDFWLDNVQCFGDEASLHECTHLEWGEHDCVLREAAGVFCAPKKKEDSSAISSTSIPSTSQTTDLVTPSTVSSTTTTSQQPHNLVHLIQVQPVHTVHEPDEQAPRPRTPRPRTPRPRASQTQTPRPQTPRPQTPRPHNVEPFVYNTAPPIYGAGSTPQTQTVSTRLPARVTRPQDRHDHFQNNEVNPSQPSGEHSHRHHLDSLRPTVSAPKNNVLPPTVLPHQNEADMLQNDAVIDAILTMEDKVNDVEDVKPMKYDIHNPPRYKTRLQGGRNSKEGRVEVNLDGQWGSICAYGWDLREANVACRQLGLNYASNAYAANVFGGAEVDKYIVGVECDGHEARLSDCFHGQIGRVVCPDVNSIAGVICTDALPDLVPNATLLEHESYLQDRAMFYLQCAMEEGCASSSAYTIQKQYPSWYTHSRRLLRFSSSTWNFGTADFRPYLRKEEWEWHQCHMHYHSMEVFAEYDLLDMHGNRVAEGHKASFCLEDVQCLPGREKRYRCEGFGDQGISVGCADDYKHDIDCQWIDISDVTPGEYIFQVHINPAYNVAELNFDNNLAQCDLTYSGNSVDIRNCIIVNNRLKR